MSVITQADMYAMMSRRDMLKRKTQARKDVEPCGLFSFMAALAFLAMLMAGAFLGLAL